MDETGPLCSSMSVGQRSGKGPQRNGTRTDGNWITSFILRGPIDPGGGEVWEGKNYRIFSISAIPGGNFAYCMMRRAMK